MRTCLLILVTASLAACSSVFGQVAGGMSSFLRRVSVISMNDTDLSRSVLISPVSDSLSSSFLRRRWRRSEVIPERPTGSSSGVVARKNYILLTAHPHVEDRLSDYVSRSFALYPNPASTIATVLDRSPERLLAISVYDELGRLMRAVQVQLTDRSAILNVSTLPRGTYLVRIDQPLESNVVSLVVDR